MFEKVGVPMGQSIAYVRVLQPLLVQIKILDGVWGVGQGSFCRARLVWGPPSQFCEVRDRDVASQHLPGWPGGAGDGCSLERRRMRS